MFRPVPALLVPALLAIFVGCSGKPAPKSHAKQPIVSEPCELSIELNNSDYCGGEHDRYWHLTAWSLRNDSSQRIDEAVIIVSLFDKEKAFLGHHAVTFGPLLPGETAQQKRLLFLKSDSIGHWRPRCEIIQSLARGNMTTDYRVVPRNAGRNS